MNFTSEGPANPESPQKLMGGAIDDFCAGLAGDELVFENRGRSMVPSGVPHSRDRIDGLM